MHELALMTHVVNLALAQLRDAPGARPITVRLKINRISHLHDLDASWLDSAFAQAARGTIFEGTTLEVIRVPLEARCRTCGAACTMSGDQLCCPSCGSEAVMPEDAPEVVLHEIVLAE